MRMWNVNPKIMCRRHLLGEHLECHMFLGAIRKGTSLKGFLDGGILEVHTLKDRHDALAEEMLFRGYKHNSPLILTFDSDVIIGHIDCRKSLSELIMRCSECEARNNDYP